MALKKHAPVPKSLLRTTCDPEQFDFESTEELPEYSEFVGQERALTAAHFGIGILHDGFNIFALGPTGVGKRSVIRTLLEQESQKRSSPKDICYIHNFEDHQKPLVLMLEPGQGNKLAEDMRQLVEILRSSIPAILENETYQARIKEIQGEMQRLQEEAFSELEREAESNEVVILRTPQGFMLAATKDGEIISEDDFAKLPKEERERREKVMKTVHDHLTVFLEKIPNWNKEQRKKIKEAFQYFTMLQVGSAISDVKKKYHAHSHIAKYLAQVQKAILDNPTDFRKRQEGMSGMFSSDADEAVFNRYSVNVLVDNNNLQGAPVIYEDNPTFTNLVGRIDHRSQFGALMTDFTLIRAGALHKANGGFLLLDAVKLLSQPFAWEALKRVLRAKEVKVENIQQLLGFMGTVSIEPEPMPLDVKVVLLGNRQIYYLLCTLDHDFTELFKVGADFDDDMELNEQNSALFAHLLKNISKKDNLKSLSRASVASTIEFASRLAGDAKKISIHIRKLSDLLREADHYAGLKNKKRIEEDDIQQAIHQQIYRASRIRDKQFELIEKDILMIECEGSKVGQLNGLSYMEVGGFAFGRPNRITARISVGKGDVIDIEREVKLGGPIHSKGVMILSGYLLGHYAKDEALALSASIVFEQSYGPVEGDSASVAETVALLSAIGDIPLRQGIAITGSMNQYGQVQPIGGVNEKIEGFFDICHKKGLKKNGVLIPKANIQNLMLRKDVIEAVSKGQFCIYTMESVDDALEILTDMRAGARDRAGKFPKGTINEKIEATLSLYAKKAKRRTIRRSDGRKTK